VTFVIDASVAIKWVVTEPGTPEALVLLRYPYPIAPELLFAECANILWKKVRRRELSPGAAMIAARSLSKSKIRLVPLRRLLPSATGLALQLDHPAYDCTYLALALRRKYRFVTADDRLVAKLRASQIDELANCVATVSEMADSP
jgi:predicted nucleic acid-binding protein